MTWWRGGARKAIRFTVAFALLLALAPKAALRAQNAAPMEGFWHLQIPNGDGTIKHVYFRFHQEGERITGIQVSRNPAGNPIEGTFKGNVLHVEAIPRNRPPGPPPPPDPRRAIWDGEYADGELTMRTVDHRGRKFKGIAVPTTEAETLPPPPLPLPAPRVLPDNGLVRTPPMGWNSWNKFASEIDDKTVRAMADAMVSSGMLKAGYTYINIDDTWEGERGADGQMTSNTKFPNMKALADYVHSKGLKIGLYSSPGPKTCAEYEGSFGHEEQDAKTFEAWGIDYLKYDQCSASRMYADTPENIRGLYLKMGEALQALKRPIVYSLCEYGHHDVWTWGADVGGNLWRTSVDINDSWKSMDSIGFKQLSISSYTRPGHWNDPDMLEIGNGGMSAEEYRTHMSLWSLLAAPLLAGNDLRTMSAETKSILLNGEVIAIDQDAAAKPVHVVSEKGTVVVVSRLLADGSVAVGLFNRGPADAEASFAWDTLPGRPAAKAVAVRDLWKHVTVKADGDVFATPVPSHGVVLLRVSIKK